LTARGRRAAGERAGRPGGWGPRACPVAVAVTFDNLGEATDVERGLWPQDEPVGRHFSVTRALPRVLELLAEQDLAATFFVEGLNAEVYPDALGAIAAAGHEVAYHGWRHERWADLGPSLERELLERGVRALASLSLRPVGFRPPGGALAPASLQALKDLGFAYCSPAGQGATVRDGVAVLPFPWPLIDAFHYLPHFAGLREATLGAGDVLSPAALCRTVVTALDDALREGALLVLVFHPFLADADDRLQAIRAALAELRALVADGMAWCAPLRELAAWIRDQPDVSSWPLRLDEPAR